MYGPDLIQVSRTSFYNFIDKNYDNLIEDCSSAHLTFFTSKASDVTMAGITTSSYNDSIDYYLHTSVAPTDNFIALEFFKKYFA